MNLRVALLMLADKHNLSLDAGRQLKQLAVLDAPPPSLLRYLPFGLPAEQPGFVGPGLGAGDPVQVRATCLGRCRSGEWYRSVASTLEHDLRGYRPGHDVRAQPLL